jgi:hypothetical protein
MVIGDPLAVRRALESRFINRVIVGSGVVMGNLDVVIAVYPAGEPGSGPYGLTAGPDDAVWFTQVHRGRPSRDLTGPDGDRTFSRGPQAGR